MATKAIEDKVRRWNSVVNDHTSLLLLAQSEPCIRSGIATAYRVGVRTEVGNVKERKNVFKFLENVEKKYKELTLDNRLENLKNFDENNDDNMLTAAQWVWKNRGKDWISENIFRMCAAKGLTNQLRSVTTKPSIILDPPDLPGSIPFDRRLDRLETEINPNLSSTINQTRFVPHASAYGDSTTTAYLISQQALIEKLKNDPDTLNRMREKITQQYKKMIKDDFYIGVPALQNYYALVRLFGSEGGHYLVNQKNQRRWYEVDVDSTNTFNYASTPTTASLISWGQADPYGRTPYQFTDFVFSKHWNKIANNRLITLRRYAAPILDNLKFPGMVSPKKSTEDMGEGFVNISTDAGSIQHAAIPFPPMATAVTYFGEDTENSLSNILKFTTGMKWDEAEADVWSAQSDNIPSATTGPGAMFGGLGRFAEMLNVAGGKFDRALAMNDGIMPPDPYVDGPYENRIKGPLNRIDRIKKRAPGLEFTWDGLDLVFEYVARPVGGINPKAVLLDIMSNFLTMGSASAVFFGGAHRFMSNPAIHPFLGGEEGYERWYRGDPVGWAITSVKQFTQGGAEPKSGGSGESAITNIFKTMQSFFQQLFSGEKGNLFGSINTLLSSDIGKNVFAYSAGKTGSHVPYLQGMKAILTGEPVGEWHVTIGNPLNPIAMIGNLICEGIEVEFNEELGPDDFPTEMKITVKLKHAMDRDRDAIESVFNRGMGRIYNLPDSFSGSADYQTSVDAYTKDKSDVGLMPGGRMGILMREHQTGRTVSGQQLQGTKLTNTGEPSIWSRASFNLAVSETSATEFIQSSNEIFTIAYRAADWIAQRSLQ